MSDPIMNQEREAVACAERIVERTYNCGELEIEAKIVAQAFLALRSGGEGWRPIKSAPKDGTYILVTEGGIAPQFVVRWQRYDGSPNGGYWAPRCGVPVYWHALPASPSTQGEG